MVFLHFPFLREHDHSPRRMYGEDDHGSIAEFQHTYALREFDGKSNECLKKTWPAKK